MSQGLALHTQTLAARLEFDRWSVCYDRGPLQSWFFRPAHDWLLRFIGPEDRCLLDVGCGTGIFAARVCARFAGTRVWGLDVSSGMLRQAEERARPLDGRLRLLEGDSAALPFPANHFDVVTCSHSFHHYPDQRRVVAEMHRVLRPGGRLLIIDGDRDGLLGRLIFDHLVVWWEGPVHHRSATAFREIYLESGFRDVVQLRHRGWLPFLLTVGRAHK